MPTHDLIVIGASAGGVEAILQLVRELPADLPAAICLVQHTAATAQSYLPELLMKAGPLPAIHAVDQQIIETRHIYVAPPDYHMIAERGRLRLEKGPRVNHTRPAIDPLFRSAANAYGPRLIGVLLSGRLDDGAAGMLAISQHGGTTIAQEPAEALYPDMPRSAIFLDHVKYILPLVEIADVLNRLTREKSYSETGGETVRESEIDTGAQLVDQDIHREEAGELVNAPTAFVCPDCNGPLWELRDGRLLQFRCRIGHLFSPEVLLAEHGENIETAQWNVVRTMEEHASLKRRMATRRRELGDMERANQLEEEAVILDTKVVILRQQVLGEK